MRSLKKVLPVFTFVCAILVIVLLLFTQPQDPTSVSNEANGEVFTPTLTIDPQEPSESILVSNATLEKPGFISAFKTMNSNTPDETNFSGVSGLIEGSQENIQVPLTTPSIEGETYTVIIHVDDGDGIFEFPGDDSPSTFADGTANYVRTTIATPSAEVVPQN